MIYRFQPFSITKELGKEYNAHCSAVPNPDDWILITDYDTLFLTTKTFDVINTAIARYPYTEIFGAVTNRVGYSFQRITREQSENDSILYHMAIAEDRARVFADGRAYTTYQVGGFFLLFRKSYWMKSPFQDTIVDKNGKFFDYNFCLKAKRMRIILGAYLWHTYRLGKDHKDKSHLYGNN